jgi:hypothetical protein
VPLAKSVRSRVVPAGTTTLLSVMVEQDFLFLMASAAPLDPEKEQLSARASRDAGAATTDVAASAAVAREVKRCIVEATLETSD